MVLSAFSGKRLWVDAENGARLVTASGAPKTRKGRCSAPVVAWALCLALAAFNVYYTWCLHARIGALEAGVEARTADALLEKSDSPFSSGIVGQPTSADEDQVPLLLSVVSRRSESFSPARRRDRRGRYWYQLCVIRRAAAAKRALPAARSDVDGCVC